MLKRLGIVAGASAALLLTTTTPAFAADGAVVSGPASAAVGSTVQMSVVYTIDDVAALAPLTALELRTTLFDADALPTPTGASLAANNTTGVSCVPTTDEGEFLRSKCVWTLPQSGSASVTVTYDVGVASTATVGDVWVVGAALYDQAGTGNPIVGATPGQARLTITAAPTASPSPTASAAPTASASPSSAPLPTAVPAGVEPGEGSSSAPLLWGLALVAGSAALVGGGRLVARQRH